MLPQDLDTISTAAARGDPVAQCNLGLMYLYGIGVRKDEQEAVVLLRKASQGGVTNAAKTLVAMQAVDQVLETARSTFITDLTVRAETGDVEAQGTLGLWYEMGTNVTKNQVEALKWHLRAATQGYVRSQHSIGFMYMLGQGTAKNEAEGTKWFRKAADQGFAPAQYSLALAYQTGSGVEKDLAEAAKWYRRAADSGDRRASEALAELQ